jgi:hypothetical protein
MQTEGIAQGHTHGKVPSIPDCSTISRRIKRLDIKIGDNKSQELQNDYIVIAIYNTGIKVTNRGQWNVKKKGFENICSSKHQK